MMFPLDYSGEIGCNSILISNVENFQREFMKKVEDRLKRARATIVVRGNEIHFKPYAYPTALLHMDSGLLSSVPSGKIILNSEEGVITYYLNFRKGVIALSLFIWAIFGALFILGMSGSLVLKIIIVGFAWLFMMIGSSHAGIHRFKLFVNRILKEMNASEI